MLSDRANMISGGEALVAVTLPKGTNPAAVKVTAGGRDVTNRSPRSAWSWWAGRASTPTAR